MHRELDDFEEFVLGSCTVELAGRGMRPLESGILEVSLSARFTGWVGMPWQSMGGRRRNRAVVVRPLVGVRDEEVSRLVTLLQGLAPGDPAAQPRNVVVKELRHLIPERGRLPDEWIAAGKEGVGEAARRIADDVVLAGFPYMERLAAPESFFEEFKAAPRRLMWPRESAVTYMMHGELEDARRMLWRLARPVSQRPTVWGDKDAAAVSFFEAFASYFGVDLGIGDWPVRERRAVPRATIKIRDRGVVPAALGLVGREDLAQRGAALSEAEVDQIGERASAIFAASKAKDPDRAIGLAAVEFLSPRR